MLCWGFILQVPSEHMDHLPEPAVELWQKVVPLGMIFFCASFNLTILQVKQGGRRGVHAQTAHAYLSKRALGGVNVVAVGKRSRQTRQCWLGAPARFCVFPVMPPALGTQRLCCCLVLRPQQSLKDAIVVTAGGAETLPFLASFCVLPASLAFFVLYGKLVRHLQQTEQLLKLGQVLPLHLTPIAAVNGLAR